MTNRNLVALSSNNYLPKDVFLYLGFLVKALWFQGLSIKEFSENMVLALSIDTFAIEFWIY